MTIMKDYQFTSNGNLTTASNEWVSESYKTGKSRVQVEFMWERSGISETESMKRKCQQR